MTISYAFPLEAKENLLIKVGLGHLEGRSNKFKVNSIFTTGAIDKRDRVEWVLRGPTGASFTLKILSGWAGTITQDIKLGKGD